MRASVDRSEVATTEWMRELRAVRRNEFVSRYTHLSPPVWHEPATASSPVIDTPMRAWGGEACYTCSFCRQPCTQEFRLELNQVLTRPFVVTCGPCTQKIR